MVDAHRRQIPKAQVKEVEQGRVPAERTAVAKSHFCPLRSAALVRKKRSTTALREKRPTKRPTTPSPPPR